MESKIDLETKLREQKIAAELKAGFEDRANKLRAESIASQQQTVQMMKHMQKESMESQTKLTQMLMQQKQEEPKQQQPVQEQRPPGLLTSILAPVTGVVDGLLGKLL